ncbi:hypothetical protein [Kitasatospora purpeofusca]|uniref:hypothetical protein n=1 Tax=Kitasatospora purpeofusca TaxID=67352 RepID=UPI003864C2ED|nr:hypothetical protein OIP63_28645 [Kitasatospora purpeofusca]
MTPGPPPDSRLPDTGRVGLGTCTGCGVRAVGYFVDQQPGRPARVEHCAGDETRRDPPRLTAAAAVSVAAVVVLGVLLLTIWR